MQRRNETLLSVGNDVPKDTSDMNESKMQTHKAKGIRQSQTPLFDSTLKLHST